MNSSDLTRAASWPPRSSDAAGLLDAYLTVLGWPLCADGATVDAGGVPTVRTRSPRAMWSTLCGVRFDAVAVPAEVGRSAALLLEKDGVAVPCLLAGPLRLFLVKPGTGPTPPGVRVLSGQQRLVIPPTDGLRWETPPWNPTRREPLPLPHGQVLPRRLRDPETTPARP